MSQQDTYISKTYCKAITASMTGRVSDENIHSTQKFIQADERITGSVTHTISENLRDEVQDKQTLPVKNTYIFH